MTVSFYYHTVPTDPNERKALYRIARIIHAYDRLASNQHIAVIANINPSRDKALKKHKLTQLDALILSKTGICLVELKHLYEPFDGRNPNGRWMIHSSRKPVESGAARNPYKQVQRARHVWQPFLHHILVRSLSNRNWSSLPHIQSLLLFHPFLHPKSRLMPLGKADMWLQIGGMENVARMLFADETNLKFSNQEIDQIAATLNAKLWAELHYVAHSHAGFLSVSEPDGSRIIYPIGYGDSFTIGRSRNNNIQVSKHYQYVSSFHAQIDARQGIVQVRDLNSRHGILLNGQMVRTRPYHLKHKDWLVLGPMGTNSCLLTYYSQHLYKASARTTSSTVG